MPLVILHHLLNVFVQLANKRGLKKKKKKKRKEKKTAESQQRSNVLSNYCFK
jgi:hypothetical protein